MKRRKCRYPNCGTILNQYTKGDFCSVHQHHQGMQEMKRKKASIPHQRELVSIPFEELTEFRWPVWEPGYSFRIIDDKRILVGLPAWMSPGSEMKFRFYSPYRNKNLFVKFASLNETDIDEILRFIDEHGLLTAHQDYFRSGILDVPFEEPLDLYIQEIRHVHNLFTLHSAIQDKDLKSLRKRIKISENTWIVGGKDTEAITTYLDGEKLLTVIPETEGKIPYGGECLTVEDWTWLLNTLNKKDIVSVANFCLGQELANNIAPYIFLSARLTKKGKLESVYSARNLLGVIYTQLYMAVTERWHYRKCKECGNLFTLTRKDKQFCNKRCENRYYVRQHRKRKRKEVKNNG